LLLEGSNASTMTGRFENHLGLKVLYFNRFRTVGSLH
jgi:hypothetical protein